MFKRNESIIFAIELIVDKQIRYNHPPETAHTYRRLITSSFSDAEARRLIYLALQVELIQLMRNGEAFNNERFITNLSLLPELPEPDLN